MKSLLIKEQQKSLLAWYDFRRGARVLYVGQEVDAHAELLRSRSGEVYDEAGRQIGK